MFKKIMVALDHSKADSVLLSRVKELARITQGELLLVHVSTGWAAHWREDLNLADSQEMKEDRDYLERVAEELHREGYRVTTRHACGEPANEVLKAAHSLGVDLIAMAMHGHRGLSDLIHGTTITKVRHESDIPLFLVRAPSD
jgi:nucleotide-binding universal stress UspA family protein